MCTPRESKLFKAAINSIPEKAIINVEIPVSIIDEELPTKDRETARKHSASRRKAKVRERNRKATAYQRSCDLYNSGLDRDGKTFKARCLERFASLDETSFANGNDFIDEADSELFSGDDVKVEAEWTGSFPCRCHGEWKLIINGIDVSEKIPEQLRNSPMETYGEYYTWHFADDWTEEWESYTDGLHCFQWTIENREWLMQISEDADVHRKIFEAVQAEDWRHGECGGCI